MHARDNGRADLVSWNRLRRLHWQMESQDRLFRDRFVAMVLMQIHQ
jgi:hypothetical protein